MEKLRLAQTQTPAECISNSNSGVRDHAHLLDAGVLEGAIDLVRPGRHGRRIAPWFCCNIRHWANDSSVVTRVDLRAH